MYYHHLTRGRYQSLRTREDLALTLGVDEDAIEALVRKPARWYGRTLLPKSDGGVRVIRPPRRELKDVQRRLVDLLQIRLRFRSFMHGGVPRKSIVTHASSHSGREMVATLDVRGFFDAVPETRLWPLFRAAGILDAAAEDVMRLVTLDGHLPQGAPTSCLLANLVFYPADLRVKRICTDRGLEYTRYVDDLAVSGDSSFKDLKGPLQDAVRAIGFNVAPEKVHFMSRCRRQLVTGLVVNDRVRPTREFTARLRHRVRLVAEGTAHPLATVEGLSLPALRTRLVGQIRYLGQFDRPLATRLERRLRPSHQAAS